MENVIGRRVSAVSELGISLIGCISIVSLFSSMKGMDFWKLLDLLAVRGVVPVSSVVSFYVKKNDFIGGSSAAEGTGR